MQNLKPCPCGKTPESLHIADNGSKWAYVSGNCCNGWSVEFRTQYHRIETDECMVLAIKAWNEGERRSLLTPLALDGLRALIVLCVFVLGMCLGFWLAGV